MTDRFYARERNTAKSRVTDPLVQEYITRLEAVANAAWEVYKNVPHASRPSALGVQALNDLYDALAKVDFMVEEEDYR